MPQMPGIVPKITTPPIRKTAVQHCGYTSLQGKPERWQCPGCGEWITPPGA